MCLKSILRRIILPVEVILVGWLVGWLLVLPIFAQDVPPRPPDGNSPLLSNLNNAPGYVLMVWVVGQIVQMSLKYLENRNTRIEKDEKAKVVEELITTIADRDRWKAEADRMQKEHAECDDKLAEANHKADTYRERWNDLRIENAMLKGKEPPSTMGQSSVFTQPDGSGKSQ